MNTWKRGSHVLWEEVEVFGDVVALPVEQTDRARLDALDERANGFPAWR